MLGLDEATQKRWRVEDSKQSAIDTRQRALEQHIQSNTITVEDDSGKDVSDILSRLGKPLTCQQVIEKLQKCNPRLVFERSKAFPNMFGIYLSEWVKNAAGTWELEKKHICGMEAGIMPELSVIHKKKVKIPNQDLFGNEKPTRELPWREMETFEDETRGWRTVLVRLLHSRLITESDVTKHFGWNPSVETSRWKAKVS